MTRLVAVVCAGAALLVACSNDPPPQGDSPPLVSTRPPSGPVGSSPEPSASPTPSATPSETPTTSVADGVCSLVDQTLLRTILKARKLSLNTQVVPELGVPTYDVCGFTVTPASGKPYTLRFGASVLSSGPADLTTARRAYDVTQPRTARSRTVAVGQGGYATSRSVVYLGSGRLIRVSGPATFAQRLAVARAAVPKLAALPAAPTEVTLPECERGGAAAAKVIGAPPTIRRDVRNRYGDTECGWAIASRAVSSTAARVQGAERVFEANAGKPGAEPVPLGDEALYDARTHAVQIRVGADKVATFAAVPAGQAGKNDVIGFALRLSGLYTR